MKKLIMATVIAACIALCAAVWSQSKASEKTPVQPSTAAVCAPEAIVAAKIEVETIPPAEKEKEEVLPTASPKEVSIEPETTPVKTPAAHQKQPTPESEIIVEASPKPAPEQTAEPQTGDIVYVPGFGWIENQGPNHADYAADMYENGNKIGFMG